MKNISTFCALLTATVLAISPSSAQADNHKEYEQASTLEEALLDGQFDGRLRYRYQFLDVEGFTDEGQASTLQTLLKYETKPIAGVSVLGEVRSVQRIGASNLQNDSLNDNTSRPAIPDPDAFEIDQLLVKVRDFVPDTQATFGRRKINLNNQRFISILGFRQSSNSFDGLFLENWSLPDTRLLYSYSYNFNRAFTDDSPVGNFDSSEIHLFHAEHKFADWLQFVGYGYLLGIDEDAFDPPADNSEQFATNTYGFNLKGDYPLNDDWTAHYDFEFAHQTDNAESPDEFSLNYYRFVPGVSYKNWRFNLGYESLEGDGTNGFSTPFALLHAFNGYADVFVPFTPAEGFEDFYVNATYSIKETPFKIAGYDVFGNSKLRLAYHTFDFENSGGSIGDEIDISFKKKIRDDLAINFEYAHYRTDFDGVVSGTNISAAGTPLFNRDIDQFYVALIYNF